MGEVRDWHQSALLSARPVVIAVGDVDPEEATAALAGVLVDRPSRNAVRNVEPLTWVGAAESIRMVSRDKAQTALAMLFPGPRRRDPDRAVAEVWAAVASGLGGRMFEALRDRRSLAYTVLASSWQKGQAGALITYIATSPEREAEARSAMVEELEEFKRTPVSPSELRQAVNYLAGQAEVSRQTGGAVLAEILEAWMIGNGLADLEDPKAAFHAVSATDITELASRHLLQARRAEGVIRGASHTRAGEAATASR